LTRGNDAVERSGHVGITEIDLSLLLVGLCRLQVGLCRIPLCQSLVVISLGRNLFTDESGLALILGLRLCQRGLRAYDGCFRRINFQLVGLWLDGEERSAFLHKIAISVTNRLNKTLHARNQIDRVHGSRAACGLEIARDLTLDGRCDRDLRRWRCGVLIILPAGGEAHSNPYRNAVHRNVTNRRSKLCFCHFLLLTRSLRWHLNASPFVGELPQPMQRSSWATVRPHFPLSRR